jgi:hypothetical protein
MGHPVQRLFPRLFISEAGISRFELLLLAAISFRACKQKKNERYKYNLRDNKDTKKGGAIMWKEWKKTTLRN